MVLFLLFLEIVGSTSCPVEWKGAEESRRGDGYSQTVEGDEGVYPGGAEDVCGVDA